MERGEGLGRAVPKTFSQRPRACAARKARYASLFRASKAGYFREADISGLISGIRSNPTVQRESFDRRVS